MVTFTDLPLEIKLLIIEKEPTDLGKLLLVDKEIYNFYITDQGQNWYNRISRTYIDTPLNKGFLRFNQFKDGEWKYYNKDILNKTQTYRFGISHGPLCIYYDNGHVKLYIEYIKGKREGISYEYHRNDIIKSSMYYINGVKDGEYISYHENKNLYCKYTYLEGNIHGIYEKYYKDGKFKSIENYDHGKKHGICKYENRQKDIKIKTYEKGILTRKERYQDNIITRIEDYMDNGSIKEIAIQIFTGGKLRFKFKMINGAYDDKYMEYHDNGIPAIEKIYDMDNIVNKKEYYISGKLKGETRYNDKSRQIINFYESGHIQYIAHYNNGRLDGELIRYHDDIGIVDPLLYNENIIKTTKIKENNFYIKGREHGTAIYYSSNGDINCIKIYNHGTMTESCVYLYGKPHQRVYYREDGSILNFVNYFELPKLQLCKPIRHNLRINF